MIDSWHHLIWIMYPARPTFHLPETIIPLCLSLLVLGYFSVGIHKESQQIQPPNKWEKNHFPFKNNKKCYSSSLPSSCPPREGRKVSLGIGLVLRTEIRAQKEQSTVSQSFITWNCGPRMMFVPKDLCFGENWCWVFPEIDQHSWPLCRLRGSGHVSWAQRLLEIQQPEDVIRERAGYREFWIISQFRCGFLSKFIYSRAVIFFLKNILLIS